MNTNTKKNKNKSKQNKPQTGPKTETTNLEVEKDESKQLDVKCEIKSDERVPEIVSEVAETVTKEEDTPKKPKRNRGKKKKNEKEDLLEEEEQQENVEPSGSDKIAVETKCDPETAPKDTEEEVVDTKTAPNKRKKKNKHDNKEQNKEIEQVKEPPSKFEVIADHPLKITKLTKSEAENIMSDVKIITCVPISGEGEQEKKKKNKKKKRSDSEKSEKDEVSCISAFQKILEPTEVKNRTTKIDENPIDSKETENVVQQKQNVVDKVTLDMTLQEPDTKSDKKIDSVQEIPTATKDDSGKGKKRNKKNKYTKSESEDEYIKTPEPKKEPPKTLETKLETSKTSEAKQELQKTTESPKTPEPKDKIPIAAKDTIEAQELISREGINESKDLIFENPSKLLEEKQEQVDMPKKEAPESLKSKAKIAKQVEKKSKDIQPELSSENITEPEFESSQKRTAMGEKSTFEELIKLPVKEETAKLATDLKAQVIIEDEIKTIENIQVIDNNSQKKRKKSPKPQRVEEIKIEEKMFQKALAEKKGSTPEKEHKHNYPTAQTDESVNIPEKKETIENLTKSACDILTDPPKCIEDKENKISKAKSIPLPFTETIKIDEAQKSEEVQKSCDAQKSIEIQKPTDKQISEEKKQSFPEIKQNVDLTEGEISEDIEKTVQVCEKSGKASEKTDQAFEGQQFDRIPTPDGGMGKKRRKSPKPQRKHDDKNQEIKGDSDLKEDIGTSANITKTVAEKDDNLEPTPADFKMLKDGISKGEKDLTPAGISSVNNPTSSVSLDENPGVLLLRKLASPLPMIKRSGESSLVQSDNTVTKVKSMSMEDSKELLQKHDKKQTQPSEKSESGKSAESSVIKNESEKAESVKTTDTSTPTMDITKTQKDDTKKSKESSKKTDLKSKMMEVNQDMEGLRKSIEKSLAELSVMDKNEKATDQQFIDAQSKLKEIKDMALKQQSNIRQQTTLSLCAKIDETKTPNTEKLNETESEEILLLKESASLEKYQPGNTAPIVLPMTEPPKTEPTHTKVEEKSEKVHEVSKTPEPPKRDNKGKGKSKKKGKEPEQSGSQVTTTTGATSDNKDAKTSAQKSNTGEKTEQKCETQTQEKGKQQCNVLHKNTETDQKSLKDKSTDKTDFEQIENIDETLTSSVDSVNKSFEMITAESNDNNINSPDINVKVPSEEEKDKEKQSKAQPAEKDKTDKQSKNNPVSQPKNLLGHPSIPARSNKMDYKKEKNKTPNSQNAKVKVRDSVTIEKRKESKDTQTENKQKIIREKSNKDSISTISNENEEYVYKYSFRRVYLPSACHVCKMDLKQDRTPCNFCNLVFYCSPKHRDEDCNQHQALCFAVSTIVKLKDQNHVYAHTSNITGHDYRLLRMQMIVTCEKVLQRRLIPCEQEMLLYPRICADPSCREWRQEKLVDCAGCGQISYCSTYPRHFPSAHQRWCKSYSLYHKLVCYQQTRGRLEPRLPTRVIKGVYQIPDNMNEVLASLYEEKIDMSDIQYAALTQIATAPLTAAYFHQLFTNQANGTYANGTQKKPTFTIHVVGAELQFEADALNKWEVFFLHLRPHISELRVVLIGADLNPGCLPLELLGKIKLCADCRNNRRRVVFDFQDKRSYSEYWASDFTTPDLVCAFNPSIERASVFNGKDPWPSTIKCIFKQRVPFILTSYTINELHRDLKRIKEINSSDFNLNFVSEPILNGFASVRPDRNFISDDEIPLLFKNYCCMMVCGNF